jgi:hypothetical protein
MYVHYSLLLQMHLFMVMYCSCLYTVISLKWENSRLLTLFLVVTYIDAIMSLLRVYGWVPLVTFILQMLYAGLVSLRDLYASILIPFYVC